MCQNKTIHICISCLLFLQLFFLSLSLMHFTIFIFSVLIRSPTLWFSVSILYVSFRLLFLFSVSLSLILIHFTFLSVLCSLFIPFFLYSSPFLFCIPISFTLSYPPLHYPLSLSLSFQYYLSFLLFPSLFLIMLSSFSLFFLFCHHVPDPTPTRPRLLPTTLNSALVAVVMTPIFSAWLLLFIAMIISSNSCLISINQTKTGRQKSLFITTYTHTCTLIQTSTYMLIYVCVYIYIYIVYYIHKWRIFNIRDNTYIWRLR